MQGVALGTSSFAGGSFGSDMTQDTATAIVQHAYDAGVRIFDSAPWYGNGLAEQRLGVALRELGLGGKVRVHTKACRQSPDTARMFDFSREGVKQSVADSLQRLQLPSLDLLQVHDPEFAPGLSDLGGATLPALADALAEGTAKGVGFTGYPLSILKDLLGLASTMDLPVTSLLSYCRYTMYDTSLAADLDLLNAVQRSGALLINAAPLGMGLLTPGGPPAWHPGSAKLKEAAACAAAIAATARVSLPRLGAAFAMAGVEPVPLQRWESGPISHREEPGAAVASAGVLQGSAPPQPVCLMSSAASVQQLDQFLDTVSGEAPLTPWEHAIVALLVGRDWLAFDPAQHLPLQLSPEPPARVSINHEALLAGVAKAHETAADETCAERALAKLSHELGGAVDPEVGLFGMLQVAERSWEGVEVAKYWRKRGEQPLDASMLQRYIQSR